MAVFALSMLTHKHTHCFTKVILSLLFLSAFVFCFGARAPSAAMHQHTLMLVVDVKVAVQGIKWVSHTMGAADGRPIGIVKKCACFESDRLPRFASL